MLSLLRKQGSPWRHFAGLPLPVLLIAGLAWAFMGSCRESSAPPLDPREQLQAELNYVLSPTGKTSVAIFAIKLEYLVARADEVGVVIQDMLAAGLRDFTAAKKEVSRLRGIWKPREPYKPRKCRIDQITSASVQLNKEQKDLTMAGCRKWYKKDLAAYKKAQPEYEIKLKQYEQARKDLKVAEEILRNASMKLIEAVKSISGTENLVL